MLLGIVCFYCMSCVARVAHGFLLNGVVRGGQYSGPNSRDTTPFRRNYGYPFTRVVGYLGFLW